MTRLSARMKNMAALAEATMTAMSTCGAVSLLPAVVVPALVLSIGVFTKQDGEFVYGTVTPHGPASTVYCFP